MFTQEEEPRKTRAGIHSLLIPKGRATKRPAGRRPGPVVKAPRGPCGHAEEGPGGTAGRMNPCLSQEFVCLDKSQPSSGDDKKIRGFLGLRDVTLIRQGPRELLGGDDGMF